MCPQRWKRRQSCWLLEASLCRTQPVLNYKTGRVSFPAGGALGAKAAPLLEHTPSHHDAPAQNKRGSFCWGTAALSHSPPTGGPATRSGPQREQEQLLQQGSRTCRFQVFTPPPTRSYRRVCAPAPHTSSPLSTSWLRPASGRNWPAPKGPLPTARPRRPRGPRLESRELSARAGGGGGARRGRAGARAGARRPPAPRTKSVTSRPATLAPGTRRRERGGHGPARGSGPAPHPDPTPGVAPGDLRVHSPLWLTQVGFRSFIVRPPPG